MQTIRLYDYGIVPDTDITLALYQLFLKHPTDTEFVFENADYYFSPHEEMRADYRLSNSDKVPDRVLGIWLKQMKNCILRGNGARLWFSGHMQPITLDRCDNVTVSGFNINWKKPLVIEGTVVTVGEDQISVYIDPERFPTRLKDGWIEYDIGADEWIAVNSNMIVFEPYNKTVRRGTADVDSLGVTDLGNHVYAIRPKQKNHGIRVGDLLNLRNGARYHVAIFSEKCRDITLEDITVYSCGGLGCLAQFCHNVTYRRVHFPTDIASGRRVSGGHDDGMQITCCSGTVTVTECTFHALNDDPVNIHGCCVTCDEVVDDRTLRCRYRHRQACGFRYWAERADTVSFIARDTMNSIGTATVEEYTLEDYHSFLLTFDAPLPEAVLERARRGDALAIDNLTHTADFICTNNRFGSGRARSVLVSTPGRVRIADNYFESAGSAILMSGDSNYWFESGECHDVEISGNVFTDKCLGSYYQFCEGVISISPVIPSPDSESPFHKNIRIVNNVFDCADTPALYAYSCDGLTFRENRIFKSPASDTYRDAKWRMHLNYCKNVTVEKNRWIGHFSAETVIQADACDTVVSDETVSAD